MNSDIKYLGYGFIWLSVVAITVALIGVGADIVDSHKSGGDLSSWFAAIGTVGTLIGTIWLATADRRQRIRSAQNIAQLMAARISGELQILIGRTHSFTASLALTTPDMFDVRRFSDSGNLFDVNRPIETFADLDLLVPLPNSAATRIARGVAILQSLCEDIRPLTYYDRWQQMDMQSRGSYMNRWLRLVREAVQLLQVAERECLIAAEIAAPQPTLEEIHSPFFDDDS